VKKVDGNEGGHKDLPPTLAQVTNWGKGPRKKCGKSRRGKGKPKTISKKIEGVANSS